MALRLTSSSNEFLEITSNLIDYDAAYSIAFWVKFAAIGSDLAVNQIGGTASNYINSDTVAVTSAGVLRMFAADAVSFGQDYGTTVSAGVWYHLCVVRASTTDLKLYLNGTQDISVTYDASSRGSATYWHLGRQEGYIYGNMAVSGLKAWSRALSPAEIKSEMRSIRPVSLISLYAWWPFATGNDSTRPNDWSGRGNNWTEYNTPTTEADPPVSWGGRRRQIGVPTTSSSTTITPGTATLSLSTFAPVIKETLTPGVSALALTTFAPVLREAVTPSTASLSLTTFAPTITNPVTVTPGTAALTLTTFAPTVGQPITVTPTTAALALTTFAPTVSSTENVTVTPGTAALVLTAYAPTVFDGDSGDVAITVGTAALTLSTFVPQLKWTVTPGTAALALTGFAPTITNGGTLITPSTATLVLTTYAPSIGNTTPVPVITFGYWVGGTAITAGSEWRIVATGPAADAPRMRVTARMREQ